MIFTLVSINKKYTLYIPTCLIMAGLCHDVIRSIFTHELGQLPFFFFREHRSRSIRLLLVFFGWLLSLFHCVL